MKDPRQVLLETAQRGGPQVSPFAPTSRYHGIEATTLEAADGTVNMFIRRRMISPPEQFLLLQEHSVVQGDRIDNLSAHYLGDPLQFWRICDANAVMRPEEITETTGRRIRITLPEGIPGAQNV